MVQARSCPAAPLQPSRIALAPACPRCSLAACFVPATLSSCGASSSRAQRAREEASVRESHRVEGRFVLTYVAGDKRRCHGSSSSPTADLQLYLAPSPTRLRAKTTSSSAAAAHSERARRLACGKAIVLRGDSCSPMWREIRGGVMAAALRPPQISSSTSRLVLRGYVRRRRVRLSTKRLADAESELQAATAGAPFCQWGFYYPNAVVYRRSLDGLEIGQCCLWEGRCCCWKERS
ncbi:unnamed protein product [Urochloa humidicola]